MTHGHLSMRMNDVSTLATFKSRWLGCILLVAAVGAPSVAGLQTSKPAAQPGKAPAQTTRSRPKPKGAAGQSMQQAVPVPFNPVRRDEQGRVIQALPEPREGGGESDAHPLSRRARAEKALADSHKAPRITKPLPALQGGGKFPSRLSNVPPASGQLPHIEDSFKSSPAVVGVSFPAIAYDLKIPPDVAMAAGPNQVVVAANDLVSVFDKLGNLLGTSPFSGFDPVVHYDEYIKRFWLVIANVNNATNQSTVVVSLSNGSDATNGWSNFTLDMTLDGSSQSGHWCDYPQLGFDTQAIYVSCDMFSFPSGSGSFQYGKVRVLAKSQFLKGGCCSWYDQWNLPWVVRPAIMHQAKDSDGEYLIDAAGNQGNDVQADGGGDSGDTLDVWHFPDPIGNPSQFDQTTVSVSGYYTPPSATQPGPTTIDTGDARVLSAVWQAGHLSTTQNTLCGSNACAAYYELDVSGFPGVSVVNDWAVQLAGIDYYYPSVDENADSNKMMVYTESAGDEFASAVYVGIPNFKTCLHCVGKPEGLLAAGSTSYANFGVPPGSRNRWGDYLAAGADPDGRGVWIAGEFAQGALNWGTQVGVLYNTYQPELKVSPTAVNFGDKLAGPTVTREITLSNTGNADLTINSVKIDGSPDYSVVSDDCLKAAPPLPKGLLEAKQSCTVKVLFKPSGSGQKKAALQICDSLLQPCLEPLTVPFTFSGPAIGKITPNHGPLVGITVSVEGDGFGSGSKFTFGGSPATAVSCASATTCTMTAPAHSAGPVDVVAETGTAKSDSSKFSYQAPAISKISPSVGPTVGGESVTLTGSGFIPGTQLASSGVTPMTIHFGPNAIKTFDCTSDTTCSVNSPAGTGQTHITVSLAGVTSPDIPADVYTYEVFPSVANVTPASAPVTGGGTVTIVGTNFSTAPGGTLIEFSSLPAINVSCSSPTQCTATVPTRDASAGYLMADVTATVNDRTSINWVGFAFGKPTDPWKVGGTKCVGVDCQH